MDSRFHGNDVWIPVGIYPALDAGQERQILPLFITLTFGVEFEINERK